MFSKIFQFVFLVLIGCLASFFIFFGYFYAPPLNLTPYQENIDSVVQVCDREGKFLFYLHNAPHRIISFPDIPLVVMQAFLMAEDHEFFEHRGISYKGILRSIIKNIVNGKFAQGASTITQQVIKLSSGKNEKTLWRKIKEQYLALVTEAHYTKEQIFESYVNIAYFGSGIYGIASAAQAFWNKTIDQLNEAEAATLAAIVKSPENYCPLYNQDRVVHRRNYILEKMFKAGFISKNICDESVKKPIYIVLSKGNNDVLKHIKGFVQGEFGNLLKKYNFKGRDLTLFTTIDLDQQRRIVTLLDNNLDKLQKKEDGVNAGAVVIENIDCGLLALYGGLHFKLYGFHRALQAQRQIGSAIKPLLVYHALSLGDTLNTVYIDEPITIGSWSPHNYNEAFFGPLTVEQSLIMSNNIVPIKMLMKYGVNTFASLVQEVGLCSSVLPVPSLALGTIDSTPINVAKYFSLIQTGNYFKKIYVIKKIVDADGNLLFIDTNQQNKKIFFSKEILFQLHKPLYKIALNIGKKMALATTDIILKTGTTNAKKTCWTVAANKKYTTALYLGADDNKPLKRISSFYDTAPLAIKLIST